ncbi:MAG: hypothetical protein ACREJD_16405 [Phycisphaerales bacterium]
MRLLSAMCGFGLLAACGTSSALAAIINFSWTAIITDIGPFKAPLPGMEHAMVGDKAFITFSLNTAVPDSCQAPLAGCYYGAVQNMSYRIPRIGYVYHGNSGDLTTINRTTHGSLEEIRIEAVLPGLNANFLLWLRTYNENAISTAAIPTTINVDAFDYTYYAGFYGTTTPTSNILSGKPFDTSPCPADLNGDEVVDDTDFTVFLRAYNTLDCFDGTMPFGCPADFNADGFADDSDFVIFLAAYNELICP